ncbi:ATP-binding protein [Microbacterium rhizosphaerae]
MVRHAFSVTPAGQSPAERRAVRREITAAQRADTTVRTRKHERRLPAPAMPGPFGPGVREHGYWNLARLTVPAHQATSQHLAGIYPFVADVGLGHRGPVVGVDLNADALWHFSPWEAYADATGRGAFSTNILVLGAYRAGKSAVIKMLTTRSLPFGHHVVLPSDSKGEWVKVAEAVGGSVIRLGAGGAERLNPLDRGPRRTASTDDQHEQMVAQRRIGTLISLIEQTMTGARLSAVEHAAVHLALRRAITETDDAPTLREVHRQLGLIASGDTDGDAALVAASAQPRFVLRRFVEGDLSGLFEDASTVAFDEDAPMVVIDTSELFARGDLVAQLTQVCSTAWIQAVVSDRDAHRTRYVVREEGWRDMTSLAALQMYQQWLKLSRHYGISNIVILHKMGDLDAVGQAGSQERNLAYSIAGDIENKFIFHVNHQERAPLIERLNISPAHAEMARQLARGQFIAYVGQYSYLVDAFSTSTEWELELFQTDDAVLLASEEMPELVHLRERLEEAWPDDVDTSVDGWLAYERGIG